MHTQHQEFIDLVLDYYRQHGRSHLPWRTDHSPYRVLVSEVMLQQTQVDRVIPFFERWMEDFPTWKDLANASQAQVLKLWKGLGYNSRALRLQKLAQVVTTEYDGVLPSDYRLLCALPGIGPYTAAAVRAFAFNEYTPLIETNVRRVFIYHFFNGEADIDDKKILEVMRQMGDIDNPRQWYSALMDYGSTLPKIIKTNPNRQSKHYSKQSRFDGSDRQIRGKVLDVLLAADGHCMGQQALLEQLTAVFDAHEREHKRYQSIIADLAAEGFLTVEVNTYTLVQ